MLPEVVNGLSAIAGAILGVAGTWLVTHRYKERKRLVVIVSPLAKLLDVGDQVKSHVKILYKEQEVEYLSMGEVAIQNTGNAPVQDVQATVSAEVGSSLIDFEIGSANFSFDDSSVQLGGDDTCRTLSVDYLNADDRIVVWYKLIGNPNPPGVAVRKLGVDVVTKRDFVGWIPDIYAEVVYKAFSRLPLFNVVGRMIKPYSLYLEARKKREAERSLPSKPIQADGASHRR